MNAKPRKKQIRNKKPIFNSAYTTRTISNWFPPCGSNQIVKINMTSINKLINQIIYRADTTRNYPDKSTVATRGNMDHTRKNNSSTKIKHPIRTKKTI